MESSRQIVTPPADALLAWCARVAVPGEPRVPPPVRELDDDSWSRFLREMLRHSMVPLAWRALDSGDVQVPRVILSDLRVAFDSNTVRNLRLAGELVSMVGRLSQAGVTSAAWKGPLLAERAYLDLRLRQFFDLDLLVRRADLPTAIDVVLAHGFQTEKPMTVRQRETYVDRQGELEFVRESDGLWLELHTAIVPTYYAGGRSADDLWERLTPARVARADVMALNPVDDLEALCVHGSKHRWDRLAWIVDVAMMARLLDDSAWQDLLAGARRHGTLRMTRLGLLLAANMGGAILPRDVDRFVRADSTARSLASQVEAELFDPRPSTFDALLFHARMRERSSDRAAYLYNVAFTPSGADWESFRLPPPLFPLYALARPFRLALKYGQRVLRRPGREASANLKLD